MRAISQSSYGSSEVLELTDVPEPDLRPRDVVIAVTAAGVNYADWHLMTGLPRLARLALGLRAPRAAVRGRDAAGVVVAVGPAVSRFAVGDEVFGVVEGAFAERARADEDHVVLKPAGIGFDEASAAPTAGLTALHAVRAGGVSAGDRVLVIGAGGGVGTFAVQIAVAAGATVTGVCSTSKVALVGSLGADRVIDYTHDGLDGQFDVIIDIAGNRSLPTLRRVLSPTGTLVIAGGENGGNIFGGMDRNLRAGVLSGFSKQSLKGLFSTENRADLEELRGMLERRDIRSVIDDRYPLERAGAAIDRLAAGGVAGKIVLTLDPVPGR